MQGKTALIVGASGLVGGELLQILLSGGYYDSVSVLVRRKIPIEHQKLTQWVVNFDDLQPSRDLIKAHDVFCCLGTTMKKAGSRDAFYVVDFTYPWEIANIAAQNGSQQFLLISALGANANSVAYYFRVKGEIEQAISQLNFKSVHIFRPSLLLGKREETRRGEELGEVLYGFLSFAFVGPLRKYKAIKATQVAAGMAATAQQGLQGLHIFDSQDIQRM